MTPLNVRLTGIANLAAGIGIALGGMIHILFHNPFGHWILFFGYLLLVFALTGLYAVQARQSGLLGLAGYFSSILGTLIVSISAYLMLADVSGFEAGHEAWMFMYFDLSLYLPGMYLFLIGLTLLGLATAYSRVLPRLAGLLLAASAITALPAETVMGLFFFYYISTALLLTSLAWIGLHLLVQFRAPQPALEVSPPLSGS